MTWLFRNRPYLLWLGTITSKPKVFENISQKFLNDADHSSSSISEVRANFACNNISYAEFDTPTKCEKL